MRVWDLPPGKLCRNHLLGEHREIHAIWVIITQDRKGYSNHPETRRWRGKLKALYLRHEKIVEEMNRRGFNHNSPLDKRQVKGKSKQMEFVDSIEKQKKIIKKKKCSCRISN